MMKLTPKAIVFGEGAKWEMIKSWMLNHPTILLQQYSLPIPFQIHTFLVDSLKKMLHERVCGTIMEAQIVKYA